MYILRQKTSSNNIKLAVFSIALAVMLVVGLLTATVGASSIVKLTSNIADVPNGDSLILTIRAQNDGDIHELEVDHSFEDDYPQFSVYADEADPYGGDGALFAALGVVVTYNASISEWTIDFGDTITQFLVNEGSNVEFYFVLKDSAKNVLWGSMFPPSSENKFNFDPVNGTGDSLALSSTQDDVVIPGVPNTALGL